MNTNLRVPVDDQTLERLQAIGDFMRRQIEDVAGLRLKAATSLLPDAGRVVVISSHVLEGLEQILGGGSILNQEDLLKKVERLAGISFHHVRLPFTPNMLEELRDKAARQGLTAEQLIERTAPRVYEQFFDLMARV